MNEKQIDALEAGRELDALVAQHVMGWKWYKRVGRAVLLPPTWEIDFLYDPLDSTEGLEREHIDGVRFGSSTNRQDWDSSSFPPFPKLSTTWDGAWLVWAKMPEAKALDEAGGLFSARFHCEWGAEGWEIGYYAVGDTAPLAICKAALKVVMLG